jgi:hypothetical protein
LSFFFVDAVKETLFIHPIIAKYFTHVTRTVIWKNSDYVTFSSNSPSSAYCRMACITAPEV